MVKVYSFVKFSRENAEIIILMYLRNADMTASASPSGCTCLKADKTGEILCGISDRKYPRSRSLGIKYSALFIISAGPAVLLILLASSFAHLPHCSGLV